MMSQQLLKFFYDGKILKFSQVRSWSLASFFRLMFCRGYEIESWSRLVKILKLKFYGEADVWLKLKLMLGRDSEDEIRSRFVFELVI